MEEGQGLDKSNVNPPQIDITDLKINRSRLKMFGQTPVSGLNNDLELDAVLGRYLGAVNKLFANPDAASEMMQIAKMRLEGLSQIEDPDTENSREIEGLSILSDFALYASSGRKTEALLVLGRAATQNFQDAFAGNRSGIAVNFPVETLTKASGRVDLRDAATSLMDLTKIMYASKQLDGMPYQTKEQRSGLEEAKKRINTVNIN